MEATAQIADQSALPGRTALVLYGSETGNAQDVAEELGRLAERLRFSALVVDLNSIDVVCYRPFQVFIQARIHVQNQSFRVLI